MMDELQDISGHISDRISSLQRMVDLSVVELPQNKMKKLGQELFTLERLLEEFEKCVGRQREQLKNLKEFEASFQKDLEDVNHLKDNIPAHMARKKAPAKYMKGRVSYDQLNATVQCINTAVTAKYKIRHQSVKTLNNHSRKLHQRFKDQETKDTKGQYFVVEDDIREFTQVKADKRFQGILNMLRHCQRLRELRGGGLTRYMLL
ncbi:Spindle and kinetochore-associated protein 1 [Collichthys lucidus]|uniref:SKA complex subunit 1 n=1 Tax=Collichthys lucidus TaxID=240159 RepID=A0A4U5UHT1_COLLU|nr:Spindle and kinetochore-associated protein 1 [Collichthys lucidus]